MKEGKISEIIFGNFDGWEKQKHGIDIRKKDNSIIIELKNKYNTCNNDTKIAVLDKLANYKKDNPDTVCILGIINPKRNSKKLNKRIIHNKQEIFIIQGVELFNIVFGEYKHYKIYNLTQEVIIFVKKLLEKLL